jgi:hypothetical protein
MRKTFFIEFVDVHDSIFKNREIGQEAIVSGKLFGQLVLQRLTKFGLNLDFCVGIATDGCSVMTSEKVGAVQEIQSEAKNAVYCACYECFEFVNFSNFYGIKYSEFHRGN